MAGAVIACSHTKEEQQAVWGSAALIVYMAVWVASLLSPAIVLVLVYAGKVKHATLASRGPVG